jgi:DHA1 family bicyclomycin/chloramphenicol resistance-like MFS transporter
MTNPAAVAKPRSRTLLLMVLGALSAFGPLSMDMYLPGMPGLARGLDTTDSLAQFTISACMIGLAIGQLLSGPMSDKIGRRIPLIIGVAVFVVASLVCAASPTIAVLLVARFIQGLAGAAGIVISRAVVRDLYSQDEAARVFSRLMLVTGVAPVVAPIFGGALLLVTDWRGIFVALAVIGAVLLVAAVLVVPDSLADENRHEGGLASQLISMGRLFKDRPFVGYALASGVGGCVLFAYISMSSLVLQDDFGVSAQSFSFIFAANSLGIVAASQINAALVSRVPLRTLLIAALVVSGAASVVTSISATLGMGLFFVLIPVFIAVAAQGFIFPNTTALALGPYARGAGAAAAVLGTMQFLVGAIVPPLVSLGGTTALSMGVTMLVSAVLALVVLLTLTGDRRRSTAADL